MQGLSRTLRTHWPLILLLLAVFIAHLPHITAPPLDLHAWRQSDTAAVARNFAEESPNIFLPRIDMRNQFSGITGMEFPLYNYAIFVVNLIFGIASWHGRVVTLLISLGGLAYFWAFVSKRYGKFEAYLATMLLSALPVWFYFSRNIQPDVLMVSLSIASLYYAQAYRETFKRRDFVAAVSMFSLACLVKIPAVFVALPLLIALGWVGIRRALSWLNVAIVVLVLIVPNALWYWWSSYLSSHFGLGQYFYGALSVHDSLAMAKTQQFRDIIQLYVLEPKNSTFLLYVSMLFGVIRSFIKRDWLPVAWAVSIIAFIGLFATKSYYHNYYSLPLIPPLALLMALGAVKLWRYLSKDSMVAASVFLALVLLSSAQFLVHTIKPWYVLNYPEFINLESQMDKVSNRQDKVLTNTGGQPIMLYMAHRKGWSLLDSQITADTIPGLYRQGARYYIRYRAHGSDLSSDQIGHADIVAAPNGLIIYRLHQ